MVEERRLSTVDITTGEVIAQPDFPLLDAYSPGPIPTERPRVDPLATISAGYRDEKTKLPTVSRNGEIFSS